MKEKINKTNVARLLDKAKIAYQLVPYEVDENDLSATHVAEQLGEDIAQVFKTLILHGDKSGYFVCVIPGADEVDLKKAAKVSGNKKCEMMGTTYGRFPKQKKLIEVLEGGTGYRSPHRGVLHPMCSLFFADWFEPEFPVDWDCIGRGIDCHFRDWLILDSGLE